MTLSVAKYDKACREYKANWAALNGILYDLCRRYPGHEHRGGLNAKLWIIGRTYATGIERQIRTKNFQGSSMTQLAERVWQHRREVDANISSLRGLREPLDVHTLRVILTAHGRLLAVIQPVLRDGLSPRSFVSKYLHFHCPVVPIYDTVAVSALRKRYRWQPRFNTVDLPDEADKEYGKFVLRFWQLYRDLRNVRTRVSVKLVDEFLLALAHEDK